MRWGKIRSGSLTLLLLLTGLLLSSARHPIYISITDVEYLPEAQVVGITLRVFTDDLENCLEAAGTPALRIGTVEEQARTDVYIERYLAQMWSWQMDGTAVTPRWLGKEVELDVTFLYLEVPRSAAPQTLTVRSRMFLDQLPDQQNIVHLHCGEDLRSLRLNVRDQVGKLVCE